MKDDIELQDNLFSCQGLDLCPTGGRQEKKCPLDMGISDGCRIRSNTNQHNQTVPPTPHSTARLFFAFDM